jgi:hypothetical protein
MDSLSGASFSHPASLDFIPPSTSTHARGHLVDYIMEQEETLIAFDILQGLFADADPGALRQAIDANLPSQLGRANSKLSATQIADRIAADVANKFIYLNYNEYPRAVFATKPLPDASNRGRSTTIGVPGHADVKKTWAAARRAKSATPSPLKTARVDRQVDKVLTLNQALLVHLPSSRSRPL